MNLEPCFRGEKSEGLEDLEGSRDECWSLAVNIEDKHLGSEQGAWSWFQSIRDRATVKVDTGQNIQYCVQVFGWLLGALRDILRSIFGYKEGFGV